MARNPMDDLREMGEAVDKMGDAPPTPDEIDASMKAVSVEPNAETLDEGFVGGLDNSGVGDQDHDVTFDELLGEQVTEPPKEKPEAPPSDGPKEPEPTEESPSRRDERIKELTDRLAASEASRDKLMEAALAGRVPDKPADGDGDGKPEPELDPEVSDFFRPYVEKMAKEMYGDKLDRIEQMESIVAPIHKQSQDSQLAAGIARHLPGFTAEMLDPLQKEWEAMPEGEMKADYGMGPAGAAALAREMASKGKLSIKSEKRTKNESRLADMHNADLGGEAPGVGATLSDEEMARRIDNLSPEKVLQMLEQMENSQ